MGKGSKPRSRLAHHPRPSPVSRIACSNGHALTGNGQLHMPEPQLQLLRSDSALAGDCPNGHMHGRWEPAGYPGRRRLYQAGGEAARLREAERLKPPARASFAAQSEICQNQ